MFSTIIASTMMLSASMQIGVDATGTAIARPVGKAVLEESTGSYFQVMEFFGPKPYSWEHARQMVRGYTHEGRGGRLAHVVSGDVHFFLMLNFPDLEYSPMWIGLRVDCEKKRGKWSDDSSLLGQEFTAWDNIAPREIRKQCKRLGDDAYVPIYYQWSQFGIRWNAGSKSSNYKYMIAEFPKPVDIDSDETPKEK